MKSLQEFILESNINDELNSLIDHSEINPNGEVFIMTKLPKEKKILVYTSNDKKELTDLFTNIKTKSKEFGKYLSLQSSKETVMTAYRNLTKNGSMKGFELEYK